jgi:hypothetical protein
MSRPDTPISILVHQRCGKCPLKLFDMRRKIYRLVLLFLAAAMLSTCAGDDKPTVSAQSASTATTKSGGEGTSMPRPKTMNLSWLDQVIVMLQTNTARKETLAAFFGINLTNASSDGWSAISKYGLVKVRIYDLPHVTIDIALDVVFEDGSRPRLGDLEARLGNSHLVPRAPDDFSSGDRVAFYPQNGESPAFVRVFSELE